jgi:hypothetical protein
LFTELLDKLEARDLEGRELDARDVIRKIQGKIPHTLADTFWGSCYRNFQNKLFNALHYLLHSIGQSPNDLACREFIAPNCGYRG